MTTTAQVPDAWYNIQPDLPFALPPDLPSPSRPESHGIGTHVPPSLIRQEMSQRREIAVPAEVLDRYRQWRPTPLRRARSFEEALGTRSRIYVKYEGGNLSGSHKLNTAVAQAHYYQRAGVRRLTVGTGAGQWGTAVAAACAMTGMACTVYMVRSSFEAKPYRKTIMELLGATVLASPSDSTEVGRRSQGMPGGSLSVALAEALEHAGEPGTRFCTGSGETYSLLHQTVIGLETARQLAEMDERADVLIASLGGGSNLGGLTLPFLGEVLRGERSAPLRCVSAESTGCPKLTRGRYAYDYTDASGLTPLQKMYTLGSTFAPPAMHAGGLRYHATAKLISALYDRGLIEAAAYGQRAVFASATLFAVTEGILPAPESAHAIHGAACEARAADESGRPAVIVAGLSGHGMFDLTAYQAYRDGTLAESAATDEQIAESLSRLPVVAGTRAAAVGPVCAGSGT